MALREAEHCCLQEVGCCSLEGGGAIVLAGLVGGQVHLAARGVSQRRKARVRGLGCAAKVP